jgi:hypothetical protein
VSLKTIFGFFRQGFLFFAVPKSTLTTRHINECVATRPALSIARGLRWPMHNREMKTAFANFNFAEESPPSGFGCLPPIWGPAA